VVGRSPGVDAAAAAQLERDLQELNERLWRAEDRIRTHDRRSEWREAFVEVAREICRLNDRRADLKNQVDSLFGLGAQKKIYE
jgi:chromosome segregation ATPase